MPTPTDKDTIYIDVDDEITAIIDKVQASPGKLVALVLPKRATVLQSIVNMKLLKRAAASAHKNLVLVTSEAGLLPLAGAAGMHVAKNLQSKPEIPEEPKVGQHDEEEVAADVDDEGGSESEADASKSVGALATKSSTQKPKAEETIDVDNDTPAEATAAGAAKKAKKKSKKDKNKVPNFDKFRKRLLIGGAVLLGLIVFWYFAMFRLPKATITIKTDTTNKTASATFTASPGAPAVDVNSSIVPAKAAESPKSDQQSAPATGQKDNGAKATGTATMTAKNCSSLATPASVPAGTTLSSGNVSYTTDGSATFVFDNISGGCINFKANSVNITSQNPGPASNINGVSLAVAGRSDVSASGTASGGTTQIVKVVNQSDVDAAKAKFANNDDTVKDQLKKNLQDQGYLPLVDSFTVKGAQTTVSPDVGQQGDQVTVTTKGTYHMLGVKENDLHQIIDQAMSGDIDKDKQQIQDYGLQNATFKVVKTNNDNVTMTVDTQVAVGPKINQDDLKKQIAGQKKGDTENTIKALPGVKDVTVKYSPFWVSKTPKNTSKITLKFEKAD